MKIIHLVNVRTFTIVDDEDYEWASKHSWLCNQWGYVYRKTRGRGFIWLHREILKLDRSDPREVDHINRSPLDNTRQNLRACTTAENKLNTSKRSYYKCTSKYKGVRKSGKKWEATISRDRHRYALGRFSTELEAAKAYDIAAMILHGEFASINFS